jgi:hypothetical protein
MYVCKKRFDSVGVSRGLSSMAYIYIYIYKIYKNVVIFVFCDINEQVLSLTLYLTDIRE